MTLTGTGDVTRIVRSSASHQAEPWVDVPARLAPRKLAVIDFIVESSGAGTTDRLYHVAEDAQGSNGLTWIATVPTFGEAEKTQSETFAFRFCSLAAARDGTVFFQTYSQLWKVSP